MVAKETLFTLEQKGKAKNGGGNRRKLRMDDTQRRRYMRSLRKHCGARIGDGLNHKVLSCCDLAMP